MNFYVVAWILAITQIAFMQGEEIADIDSHFKKLVDFAQDFGNGKVVTQLPTEALQSLVDAITENYVPSLPQFYAGTSGAISTSVGKPLTRYPMLLEPKFVNGECTDGVCFSDEKAKLPDIDEVVERLFMRSQFIPEDRVGANMLLVTFANWFLDELFRTEKNTNGTHYRRVTKEWADYEGNQGRGMGGLSQLYGADSSRQDALRSFKDGKLLVRDTPSSDGRESLPSITQLRNESDNRDRANFSVWCTWTPDSSCHSNPEFYATGDERFNFHPGHLLYNHLFLREHNRVAARLARANPEWDDERLYFTTRTLLTHIVAKTIVEDYVGAGIMRSRNVAQVPYDPELLRSLEYKRMTPQIFLEFNHLYRWHGLIAEQLEFKGGKKEDFFHFLWKPAKFEEKGIPEIAAALHRTRAGKLAPRNTPQYLREITRRTIADERAQQMRSFNDYRDYFHLPRLETFEDFGAGPEITKTLAELYRSPDDIEFFVGLMVEQRYEADVFLSETVLRTVAAFAFSAVLNIPVIQNPTLWSEATLSKTGFEYVKTTKLADLLRRHADLDLKCHTLLLEGIANCEFIIEPDEWRLDNLIDFVAQDDLFDSYFFEVGTTFYSVFKIVLYVILVLFTVFGGLHVSLVFLWEPYNKLDIFEKYRITFGFANAVILILTTVPYTYYVAHMLFGPNFLDSVRDNFPYFFSFLLLHGMLYLVEVCSRLIFFKSSWMLLFHHSMWYVLLLLAAVTKSIFIFKVDFILDVCVSYESGLFVALLTRKMTDNYKLRMNLILFGCIYYFITRAVQGFGLVYLFAASGARMLTGGDAQNIFVYFFGLCAATALVLMQLHTFLVFAILYNSDARKRYAQEHQDDELSSYEEYADDPSSDKTQSPGTVTPPSDESASPQPKLERTTSIRPNIPILALSSASSPVDRPAPINVIPSKRAAAPNPSLGTAHPQRLAARGRTNSMAAHRNRGGLTPSSGSSKPSSFLSPRLGQILSNFEIDEDGAASPFSFIISRKEDEKNNTPSLASILSPRKGKDSEGGQGSKVTITTNTRTTRAGHNRPTSCQIPDRTNRANLHTSSLSPTGRIRSSTLDGSIASPPGCQIPQPMPTISLTSVIIEEEER